MKTKIILQVAIVGLLIGFGYNNCTNSIHFENSSPLELKSFSTTTVGNPMTSSAKVLVNDICQVLTTCHPELSLSSCESGVLQAPGVGQPLGHSNYNSFSDLMLAESAGALFGDAQASQSCQTSLRNLQCSSPSVQQAYISASSQPFNKVAQLISDPAVSCTAVFSTPAGRKDYYVSESGSDQNDGSKEKPWATITHASQALVAGPEGATVHVGPGTYQSVTRPNCNSQSGMSFSCAVQTSTSGTASAPVIYISDQRWGAQIIPMDAYSVWHNSGDYISIVGFEIAGNKDTNLGIHSEGSFVRVIGNHVHDIPATLACSKSFGSGGILHSSSISHDNDSIGNWVHEIGPLPADNLPSSAYCNHAHGIQHDQPRGKIQNNVLYRINTWAIVSWSTATQLQITNNLIFNSGSKSADGGYTGGGIDLAADQTSFDDSTITNNIIRNNRGIGISDVLATGTHNLISNNLLYSNSQNFLFKSGTQSLATITSDPLMVDFKMDGSGQYQLQAGSPAINAGTSNCAANALGECVPATDFNSFPRPEGSNLDLGPFEWHP